jgi:hypothetical protein
VREILADGYRPGRIGPAITDEDCLPYISH